MRANKRIGIIGCGVNGLSVAYLLLKKGFQVTVISKHHPFKGALDPTFASLFPAASVIPHSVSGENMEELFNTSQAYFGKLHQRAFPGLSIFEHYELFAESKEHPWYSNSMANFLPFEDFKSQFYPKHPEIKVLSGWKFDCFFADWKQYFPTLFEKVFENNAKLEIRNLTPNEIPSLPFDVLINCGGLEGAKIFGDDENLLYRGHLLSILKAPALVDPNGRTVSYNFSPGKEIYATDHGKSQDVYCYSRSDGLVFGGSRQKGKLDIDGKWRGDHTTNDQDSINENSFPAKILELNTSIIEHSFGVKLQDFKKRSVKRGYRFIRNEEYGLRLEAEELFGKRIIHNYGHGGAGVTLSWGCAKKVVDLVEE